MARASLAVPENVPGEFYVDSTCIDCDNCRTVAPGVFGDAAGTARVKRQPEDAAETHRALMALVACPSASIGTRHKLSAREAAAAFPEPIADGVYFCGYASPDSFGAIAYLVVRPGGNVLVDSPRAAEPLMRRVAELGGVRFMFLTHRDDVADHAAFRARFGCERIVHRADDVVGAERVVEGREPVALAEDLVAIPVPGHTRGSMALLYREQFLFSGDHLWGDGRGLAASRGVCWYSWEEQTRSMERLASHRFEWVLPGHGRRHRAPAAEMHAAVERLARAMRGDIGEAHAR